VREGVEMGEMGIEAGGTQGRDVGKSSNKCQDQQERPKKSCDDDQVVSRIWI